MTTPASPTLADRAAEAFAAYREGDRERMSELVDLLTPVLWHTARGQRLDQTSAEDVIQTAWIRLVERAAGRPRLAHHHRSPRGLARAQEGRPGDPHRRVPRR